MNVPLGGHADIIAGVLATSQDNLFKELKTIQRYRGAVPSAFDCYLLERSLQTLEVCTYNLLLFSFSTILDLLSCKLRSLAIHKKAMNRSEWNGTICLLWRLPSFSRLIQRSLRSAILYCLQAPIGHWPPGRMEAVIPEWLLFILMEAVKRPSNSSIASESSRGRPASEAPTASHVTHAASPMLW